jgi:hypothetical protein
MRRRSDRRKTVKKSDYRKGGGDYKTDYEYKRDGESNRGRDYRGGKRRTNKRDSRRRRMR